MTFSCWHSDNHSHCYNHLYRFFCISSRRRQSSTQERRTEICRSRSLQFVLQSIQVWQQVSFWKETPKMTTCISYSTHRLCRMPCSRNSMSKVHCNTLNKDNKQSKIFRCYIIHSVLSNQWNTFLLVCGVVQFPCWLFNSRDGRVVRLLNTLSDGCGFELQSRPVIRSARRLFASSLSSQAEIQKESRGGVVTSRGTTRVTLLRLAVCYSVAPLRSTHKLIQYEDSTSMCKSNSTPFPSSVKKYSQECLPCIIRAICFPSTPRQLFLE